MFQAHMRSRTFWRLFNSYVILLIALIFVSLYRSSQTRLNELTDETEKNNEKAVAEMSVFLDSYIKDISLLANKLNQTSWVQKLYSDTPSFNEQFTLERRNEIADGFSLYVGINTVVEKVLLILPYREICISAELWTDTDTFFSLMGVGDDEKAGLIELFCDTKQVRQLTLDEGQVFPDTILLCAPVESIEKSRAYICYFISKYKLCETLKKQMPYNLVSFSMRSGDDASELIRINRNETATGLSVHTRQSNYLNWSYEYGFQNDLVGIDIIEDLRSGVKDLGWMFALGLIISYLLSLLSYRPVGRLLKKAARLANKDSKQRRMSDYSLISESIDQLVDENDKMRVYTGEYEKIMRVNIIRRLLQGYFDLDEAKEQLDRYHVPFDNGDYYQVYLIEKDGGTAGSVNTPQIIGKLMKLEELLASMPGERYTVCDTLEGHMVLITAYAGEEEATIRSDIILENILGESALCNGSTVFPGSVQRGFVGVSLSYQHARDRYRHFSNCSTSAYYYPLEWESQLIAGLKAGNTQTALYILAEIRRENERRYRMENLPEKSAFKILSMIADTLYRVLGELSLDDAAYGDEFEAIFTGNGLDTSWNCITQICIRICEESECAENAGAPSPGLALKEYVLEHYSDQDLSMKMLEDHFRISMQTINHLFKSQIGDTFYSFLSKIRIERAKELLRTTGDTMNAIARQVGYGNEFSFKRAFIRHTGVRPKDYAMNNHIDKSQMNP